MTGDPVRLLSDDGADSLERELLKSVRDVGPKSHEKQLVWGAIATQVAAVSVAGTAQASSSAGLKASLGSLLPKTLAAKLLLGLAVGGATVGAGAVYLREAEPPPRSVSVALPRALEAPPPPPREPDEPKHAREGGPCENEPCGPTPSTREALPRKGAASPAVDRLAEESALLTEARARLRGGDVGGARAALDRLEQRFPRGVLGQEREVLSVELLSASGDAARARSKARAFVAAHPKSPHSQRLSRFLEEP